MSKVLIADLQILGSAFFFGIGFIGQRAVSVEGMGPMTCNALRFGLSAILLFLVLMILPPKYLAIINGEDEPLLSVSHAAASGMNALLLNKEKADEDSVRLLGHNTSSLLSGATTSSSSTSGGPMSPLHPPHHGLILSLEDGEGEDSDDSESAHNHDSSSSPLMFGCGVWLLTKLFGPNATNIWLSWKNSIVFWGLFLGGINFMGSGLQQVGITMTSANKVAFIAGFDLFLTPIFAFFIPTFKRNAKPLPSTWLAVSISIIGLFFLSDASLSEFEVGRGEMITLVSTVFWTLHITYTDIATSYVSSLEMIAFQMGFVSLLSLLLALIFESFSNFIHHFLFYLPWMMFLAIVEGLGFALMALGQTYSPPTHAAIILSLEGVFASIASYLVLHETLSHGELFGCFLMLSATLIAKVGVQWLDGTISTKKNGNILFDLESVGSVGSQTNDCASIPQRLVGFVGLVMSSPQRVGREFLLRSTQIISFVNLYIQKITGTRANQA